jgi:hypothetical protein
MLPIHYRPGILDHFEDEFLYMLHKIDAGSIKQLALWELGHNPSTLQVTEIL